tara:strand:- start:170 stop:433 length:264 start_codon:yes stop_codon:yes gene_type:complete
MTKEFTYNDITLVISKQKNATHYKVELEDKNGSQSVVYERTLAGACEYAKQWEADVEKRKKLRDLEAKAIKEMIDLDIKNGITPNLD